MEKDTVRRFFDSIKEDAQLIEQFEKAKDLASFSELAVRLGQERGFEFKHDDVEQMLTSAAAASRPLAEEELEAVAGGTLSLYQTKYYGIPSTGGCVSIASISGCYSGYTR
jgi:predicted ribosomally synthesized peptide with nif11-like leader